MVHSLYGLRSMVCGLHGLYGLYGLYGSYGSYGLLFMVYALWTMVYDLVLGVKHLDLP